MGRNQSEIYSSPKAASQQQYLFDGPGLLGIVHFSAAEYTCMHMFLSRVTCKFE